MSCFCVRRRCGYAAFQIPMRGNENHEYARMAQERCEREFQIPMRGNENSMITRSAVLQLFQIPMRGNEL